MLDPPITQADVDEGTVSIPTTRGLVAIVDVGIADQLSKYNWFATKSSSDHTYYASRTICIGGGRRIRRKMHHDVLSLPGYPLEVCVDHINGNGLDNRIANLRIANRSQNAANQRVRSNNTSGYKGVSCDRGRWIAYISQNYKRKYLGSFKTAAEAAAAYDAAAIEIYGEFARTNHRTQTQGA